MTKITTKFLPVELIIINGIKKLITKTCWYLNSFYKIPSNSNSSDEQSECSDTGQKSLSTALSSSPHYKRIYA